MTLVPPQDNSRWCKDSIIADYMDYTRHQESPEDFHAWCMLTMISAAMGRRTYVHRGYFTLYPNLFTVLVAESGVLHKSTAVNMAVDLYSAALPEKQIFAQKVTPQAFLNFLAELTKKTGRSEGLICAPEFSVFLGQGALDPTLMQILTDLYDCHSRPLNYKTIMRGDEVVKDYYIVMIAGTTPEWLKSSLPDDAVGGGFASRMLLVHRTETEKTKSFFPEKHMDALTMKCKENIIHDLVRVGMLSGEFKWTSEARDWCDVWYEQHDISKAPPGMRGYYSRKGDYLIKLGMIISAAIGDSLTLDVLHLEEALHLLERNEGKQEAVLANLNRNKEGGDLERVRKILAGSEPTVGYRHMDLQRKLSHRLNAMELANILQTLKDGGEIRTELKDNVKIHFYLPKKGQG